ncbi:hypothetical protein LCGC14_1217240 [marine sediment metagenome]|uniref:Penicillin amidase n=1 Tax=marine sediment metagenome TaxID=412755 RepID=A0A0F9LCD1_9ZZZZ
MEQEIDGMYSKVSIRRDDQGITYINGTNNLDVYYATGYAHAQDRLWQLSLQKRMSQGRLSEVFGKTMIQSDIFIRTLGIYKAAQEAVPYLSEEASQALDAYAQGINDWVKQTKQLPIEFLVLGIEPDAWTKVDSLAWSKMFALNLAGNYRDEIQKFIAAQQLAPHQFQTFYPKSEPSASKVDKQAVSKLKEIVKLQDNIESELKIGGPFVGSNAWVVSGKHTQSGAPIVANDPHLALQIPSLWYAISQKGGALSADGMSIIGLPVVIFGKNDHIAWGGTNMMADVQDLFIEQLNEYEPNKYFYQGQWKKFDTRTEFIKVKADFPEALRPEYKPIKIQIRESMHGPIISDVVDSLNLTISMSWIALQPQDTTFDAFYRLSYAKNWLEFNDALTYQVAPALNFVYADKDNNIGMAGAGKLPIRSMGKGTMPLSGKESQSPWKGYINAKLLPKYFNPPQGYLINANNNIASQDYEYLISSNFAPEHRAQRIEMLLQRAIDKKLPITPQTMVSIQKDEKDLSAQMLLAIFKDIKGQTDLQKSAIEYLNNWDAVASKESIAASIFYGWTRHIRKTLFDDELNEYWNKKKSQSYQAIANMLSNDRIAELMQSDSAWCDNVSTAGKETCEQILIKALDDALAELVKLKGQDHEQWQWGNIQHTLYSHTPFSNVKVLDGLFERRVSSGGAQHTVNVSTSYFDINEGYVGFFGGGFRQVMELNKDGPTHLIMNSTGQSGQVVSPFYDNMVERFATADMIEIQSNSIPLQSDKLSSINEKGNAL